MRQDALDSGFHGVPAALARLRRAAGPVACLASLCQAVLATGQGRLAAAGVWALNEKRLTERAGLDAIQDRLAQPGPDLGPTFEEWLTTQPASEDWRDDWMDIHRVAEGAERVARGDTS